MVTKQVQLSRLRLSSELAWRLFRQKFRFELVTREPHEDLRDDDLMATILFDASERVHLKGKFEIGWQSIKGFGSLARSRNKTTSELKAKFWARTKKRGILMIFPRSSPPDTL